jgi:hypothetical protein
MAEIRTFGTFPLITPGSNGRKRKMHRQLRQKKNIRKGVVED